MAIYSGFSHWKWWFSIVMWLFTRGYGMFLGQPHCFRLGVIRSPSATKVQPGKPRGDDRNLGHMAKKFQQKIPSHPGGVDLYFADFPGFPTIQIYQNDHENDNFYQLLSANLWDPRAFHGFPWLSCQGSASFCSVAVHSLHFLWVPWGIDRAVYGKYSPRGHGMASITTIVMY